MKQLSSIQKFAQQISPKYPEDKLCRIITSQEEALWFKVQSNTHYLVLPGMNKLRTNYTLLDKAIEAICAFEVMHFDDPMYQWNLAELHVQHFKKGFADKGVLQQLLRELIQKPVQYIACDIETRDVSWDDNRVLAIGFATYHKVFTISDELIEDEEILKLLQQLFDCQDIHFIWHNGKFDIGRLNHLIGLKARVDEDTMLMHYIGINETRGTHGLKDLAPLYLQAPQWDEQLQDYKRTWCRQNKIKLADFKYDMIPTDILLPYLAYDCVATFRLFGVFSKLMRPKSDWIYRKLMHASNVYSQIEQNGIAIDTEYMQQLKKDLEAELVEAQQEMDTAVTQIWDPELYMKESGAKSCNKGVFTHKSPKQLKWVVEKAVGHSIADTSAQTLEELGESVPFLKALAHVRKCNKYLDTYISGYEELMDEDNRIRCSYNLHGTETGRLSSSEPNLQNVPRDKRIKNLMYAAPEHLLVQLDYSQAELRVLAYLSQDPWLIDVYRRDEDLHDAVATEMYGPGFNKEQRVMAKTINFGLAYGRGPSSIARTFNKTMQEANAIIDRWYKPMPYVKEWIQGRRRMADHGEPCITPFGRERHFVMDSQNRNHIQNEYINTPIQSLASDFTMLSILQIQEWINKQQLQNDVKIVATVHDSIILEVLENPELIIEVAKECKQIMENTPTLYLGSSWNLPMKADVEVGERWGALHGIDL